jgi:hypothetical protein
MRGYWDRNDVGTRRWAGHDAEAARANLFEHWWERLDDDEIREALANGTRDADVQFKLGMVVGAVGASR